MMTIMRHVPTAALGVAVLAACAGGGGMYSQPYALFEPEQRSLVEDTLRPAFVLKIDDENRAINDTNLPVTPGLRKVVVSIPGPPGMSSPLQETITIDAKPCTRYYLGARRTAPGARDWSAVITNMEPIGECQKKFASK
jgi:hypothetical protein